MRCFNRRAGYFPAHLKYILTILALLTCACSVSGKRTDELHIGVQLTTGERSKDSSSQTTAITVERGAIAWERTSGGGGRETPTLRKEFKLSPADKMKLLKLIRSNNLLVTDSIELPRASSNFRYFEISVDVALDGKKGEINISGMRNAVEVTEKTLYQNTLVLVRELYRIINSHDRNVRFEELILPPRPALPHSGESKL